MGLLSQTDLSPWLVAFAQNIAMGLVLILIYNAVRTAFRIERASTTAALLGLIFGIAAIVSMNYPVRTPEGLSIDARTVFVLVGSLFGGPLAAVIATVPTAIYRLMIGGPGMIPGTATICAAGILGSVIAWRLGKRVRDLRGYELYIIGLINTVMITIISKVVNALLGLPGLQLGPAVAGFVIFPAGTLLLGSAFSMAHQRLVLRERQRLADIVETTSDLVWEVDAERRLTFMSDRHVEVLGMIPAEHVGKSPEDAGSNWIDEAAAREAKEAFAARRPYTNLMKRVLAADGSTKILLLNGRPIFDERGIFRGYRGTSRDITDVQRLTEELRRSRDGLIRAQSLGRIASAEVDLKTGTLVWSDEMYPLMGFDRSTEASLERYLLQIHPDDRPIYAHWRERNGQGEDSPPFEYRFTRPIDGEERWFHREAVVERDAEGRPHMLYMTQQDITERRRVEDALRRSLRSQRIMSACNQLLIHADTETRLIADICQTICEIGGYALAWVGRVEYDAAKSVSLMAACGTDGRDEAEAYMRSLTISWDEENVQGHGPMGRAIRAAEIVIERDYEAAEKNAPWRARALAKGFRSTLVAPLTYDGRVFAALGICANTTDAFDAAETETLAELGSDLAYGIVSLRTRAARNQAEKELEAAEEALQVITDHTIDGLITIDERGIILTVNRPAQEIFGYTASEVIGSNVSMLMPAPLAAEHDGYIRRYLETGTPRVLGRGREVMGKRKDGSQFPMDLQIGELPGEGVRQFIGTVRDITARRETEAQLQQAQKMEAMGQLTGGVAHDFNNLLAVLLGRLQLLEQDLLHAPELQDYVRSCIKAVDRGSTLTKSLLAFSRQQALKPAALNLNQVVDDMADILRGALGEAYDFKLSKAEGLWLADADPGQLQNALLNLILNARDAMPHGGTVIISTANTQLDESYAASHRDVRAGEYVLLSVSDTGIGMSGEVVTRAFEPFFSTKEVGKGSGLGLSMVYGFVKQSAGHVSIYSEPGKGTVVSLYLPRRRDTSIEPRPAAVETRRSTGGETILLVEDNDDLRDLTRMQLQRLGYRVIVAADAHEGLKALEDNPDITLLLSDVILPHGLNGAELAERALARWPLLRVVFMSGYNEEHDVIAQALQRRPMRLLQKPFHVGELAAQLRAALD